MSDQTSIFNQNSSPATPAQPNSAPAGGVAPSQDALATLLVQIKNERGEPKYKTVEDALVALKHSQEYIPTLKDSQKELEQKLAEANAQAARVAELERVVQELTQTRNTPQPTVAEPAFDPSKIAELVERTLTEKQVQAIAKQNAEAVANAVKTAFGDKAEQTFYEKGAELGMSRVEWNALASKTPNAVLRLLGIDNQPQGNRQPQGINTAGFQPRPDSSVGKNKKSVMVGATTQDILQERQAAVNMVNELHQNGQSVYDLTDPKVFFKHFA